MLLVTGGAGFIGSNIVASLNEAGRTDIVVNDVLGSRRQMAQSGEAPARRCRAAGRAVRAGSTAASSTPSSIWARSPTPPRPTATSSWRPISGCRCGCSTGAPAHADAVHLRLFGRDLRRRRGGLRRRLVARGAAPAQADEPLRLEQASVRSRAGRSRCAQRREAAAAMGRAEVLQRVRPERVPQGRDDEPRRQALRRCQGRQARCRLFKSHRDGIADGEQKRDFIYVDDAVAVVRWLLDTPKVSGIFNVGTGKARSFRDLISRDVHRARPRAQHRICRHAGHRSAASTSISRKPRSIICAAQATTPASRRSKTAVKRYVDRVSRPSRPLSLSTEHHVRFRRDAEACPRRRPCSASAT